MNRTVPDDGYVLCYDCSGSGVCTNCEGDATVDGALCSVCSGRRYCIFCKGTGQVRPRFFPGGKAQSELRARSADECRLYIELHPHDCGGRDFPVRSRVEKTDRALVAVYEGECPRCHQSRRLDFLLDPELPPPSPAFGGPKPSAIIDPGEFLYAADEMAKRAPSSAVGLSTEQVTRAREQLAVATAAIEEVLKFIPPDKTAPPAAAFISEIGTNVFAMEPGRFERLRLQAVLDTYRKGLEDYDRVLANGKPKPSADDEAVLDQMLANREKRMKQWTEQGRPRPDPDSPMLKRWADEEFLGGPEPAQAATPTSAEIETGIKNVLEDLASSDPDDRLVAVRTITATPVADERVLAACERLLGDRTIALLGRPYSYGEVRVVAAEAVAVMRAALGRPSPVVIEDAMIPVTAVRPLADAAGIPMEPGTSGIESSIKTLERLATLGKIPRRKFTR